MEIKIIGIIIPILAGLCMFILRHLYSMIQGIRDDMDKLDHRIRVAVTESEVRQILADKLLPIDIKTAYIGDDVIEIKHSLDTILNKYLMKEKM